ncbi:hypothetical protein ACFPRL_09055 [Pseudoclavibacter helvolus]
MIWSAVVGRPREVYRSAIADRSDSVPRRSKPGAPSASGIEAEASAMISARPSTGDGTARAKSTP